MNDETIRSASRRMVLVAGAAATAGALAGCAVYGREPGPAPAPPGDGPPEAAPPGAARPEAGGGAGALARTGDVPAGGGLILADQQVVVTQPTSGQFRGFSSICTHQGCAVASVSDGTINCPCHGSRFSIADGSVVQAAAGLSRDEQQPLPEVALSVDGDAIALA